VILAIGIFPLEILRSPIVFVTSESFVDASSMAFVADCRDRDWSGRDKELSDCTMSEVRTSNGLGAQTDFIGTSQSFAILVYHEAEVVFRGCSEGILDGLKDARRRAACLRLYCITQAKVSPKLLVVILRNTNNLED
jgi:hypothetical protein